MHSAVLVGILVGGVSARVVIVVALLVGGGETVCSLALLLRGDEARVFLRTYENCSASASTKVRCLLCWSFSPLAVLCWYIAADFILSRPFVVSADCLFLPFVLVLFTSLFALSEEPCVYINKKNTHASNNKP